MQGADAQSPCDGGDDGGEDDGGCVVVHEHSADDKQNVDEKQEEPGGHCGKRLDEQGHYALVGDTPGHCGARAGKDKHETAGRGCLDYHLRDVAELYAAVDEEGEDRAVDNGDAGGLSDGEDTGEDAAEDDDGEQKRGDGLNSRLPFLFPGGTPVRGVAALFSYTVSREALEQRDGDSGNDGRHEQTRDGGVADRRAVKDHEHARRHDGSEQRGRGHDAGCKLRSVALLFHHGDEEHAEGRRGRDGQSDDGAHEQGSADGHDGDRTLEAAEPGVDELDKGFKQSAPEHELSGQDEEGNRKKAEAVHAAIHFYGELNKVHIRRKQIYDGRDEQIVCYGKTDDHQCEEAHNKHNKGSRHTITSLLRIPV